MSNTDMLWLKNKLEEKIETLMRCTAEEITTGDRVGATFGLAQMAAFREVLFWLDKAPDSIPSDNAKAYNASRWWTEVPTITCFLCGHSFDVTGPDLYKLYSHLECGKCGFMLKLLATPQRSRKAVADGDAVPRIWLWRSANLIIEGEPLL